jgi:DNA-binding transcriptional ArsR family regulator
MKEGPDISIIAALIGNPASANMLMALMPGPALTATELAQEAGLTLSTASGHLAKLEKAGLVEIARQGRHRYFRLADSDVAVALESLMPLAVRAGHVRIRTGPRDPELRRARSCYDHLAGDLAVKMLDRFLEGRLLARRGEELRLTPEGRRFFAAASTSMISDADGGRCADVAWTGASAGTTSAGCSAPPFSRKFSAAAGRGAMRKRGWCGFPRPASVSSWRGSRVEAALVSATAWKCCIFLVSPAPFAVHRLSAKFAASAADLTFLSALLRVRHRNVKSKAALES